MCGLDNCSEAGLPLRDRFVQGRVCGASSPSPPRLPRECGINICGEAASPPLRDRFVQGPFRVRVRPGR